MKAIWNRVHLRYCLSRVKNRGYGLGNEFLPWARAFLASQVLDATLLPPAFGMNRRAYWRHFRTAPDDWLQQRALEYLLPVVEFREPDYLAHGGGDVVTALERFAAAHRLHQRRAYVLVTDGLWGGYRHVEAAREFIRSTLYQSRYAAHNLLRLRARIDPHKLLVGMHLRLGDFAPPVATDDYKYAANVSLPIEWLCALARSLDRALGDGWQLLLITDGTEQQAQPLTSQWRCITTNDLLPGDCSDLLALADSDLLVCSASSFSTLAAFLSDSPYLWFAPNLYRHPEGVYSLGDYDLQRDKPGNPTRLALEQLPNMRSDGLPRGVGVNPDGEIPAAVIEAAVLRHRSRRWQSDLVRSGVARAIEVSWPGPAKDA
ncbi:MAG: hypothetical protein ACHQDB_00395 [Steroidobacterales bacterium]